MDPAQQENPLAGLDPARPDATPPVGLKANLFRSPKERAIEYVLGFCALLSVFTTLGIAGVLVWESIGFFAEVSFVDFFTDTQWTPQFVDKHFGIWPLLSGTLLVTVIAAVVALPIGLASAVYIAEYAPSQRAEVAQAEPRTPRRCADGRLRLLRAHVRDAAPPELRAGAQRVQRAQRRARRRRDDHPDGGVAERGRPPRRPARARRRGLRPRRDEGGGRDAGDGARRASAASSPRSSSPSAARSARR